MIPSRKTRRSLSGTACLMCGLGVVANDLALAIDGNSVTAVLHQQCTQYFIQQYVEQEADVDAEAE